ncbi:MAG: hypothetical protein OHK0029_37430 [Armatimonadaceae bacterium]
MNCLPNGEGLSPAPLREPYHSSLTPAYGGTMPWDRGNPALEDYLDRLCAPLLDVVPFAERQALRFEAQVHLEYLIEDFRMDGMSEEEATDAALQEYGPPWMIGQSLLEVWWTRRQQAESEAIRRTGDVSFLYSFLSFGMFSALNLYLLQYFVTTPRTYDLYILLMSLAIVSPILAGLIAGSLVPVRAVGGTGKALGVLLLHSLVAGLMLLPDLRGLYFTIFQLVFWVPAGLFAVLGAESLAKHRRQRYGWRQEAGTGGALCRVRNH